VYVFYVRTFHIGYNNSDINCCTQCWFNLLRTCNNLSGVCITSDKSSFRARSIGPESLPARQSGAGWPSRRLSPHNSVSVAFTTYSNILSKKRPIYSRKSTVIIVSKQLYNSSKYSMCQLLVGSDKIACIVYWYHEKLST
jgi:hypothetical protein